MSLERTASRPTLELRAELLARVRSFFAARGVLEVETPALSAAGVSDPAREQIVATARALGERHYLQTSPEHAMERLLAAGGGDFYQMCRVFRDDELGRWHQPEFTLLEWYRVGWDDLRLMDETAELLAALVGERARRVERLTYAEAFERALGADPLGPPEPVEAALRAAGVDVPSGLDRDALLDLAFAVAVAPRFDPGALTLVADFPASQAALAKLKPTEPPVAARFEAFCGGLELANGFAELTDAGEQRRRFEAERAARRAAGRDVAPLDEEFLAALESLPECAGVAVGFDRVVALAAGVDEVAAAMAFAHRR